MERAPLDNDGMLADASDSMVLNEDVGAYHGRDHAGQRDETGQDPDDAGTNARDDSPEAIVRQETQYITLFRVLVIAFLLSAAALTVTFVYLYMTKLQKDRFQDEYTALSRTVISSLYLDLRLNFWIAHTLTKAVTLAITVKGEPVTNFTLPTDLWNGLTEEARFVTDQFTVSW
jgi:hypothetical protein